MIWHEAEYSAACERSPINAHREHPLMSTISATPRISPELLISSIQTGEILNLLFANFDSNSYGFHINTSHRTHFLVVVVMPKRTWDQRYDSLQAPK